MTTYHDEKFPLRVMPVLPFGDTRAGDVDAELSTFDISTDLSLEWAPAVVTTNPAPRGARPVATSNPDRGFGVALRLNF